MKILILGSKGQLGIELKNSLKDSGELLNLSKDELDITDKEKVIEVLSNFQPNFVINACAFTNVEEAENNAEIAFKVNGEAIGFIAKEVFSRKIKLIHFSTDYVFDGLKIGKYTEEDSTNPINVYGHSKLLGEQLIKQSKCHYYIFRTTWVVSKNGKNFAKTILNLIKNKSEIKVIKDQIGVPTSTELISKVIKNLITSSLNDQVWEKGIYNLTPIGSSSWFDVARYIYQIAIENNLKLSLNIDDISPILSRNYPSKVKRPLNSLLDISKVNKMIDFDLPKWEDDLYKVVLKLIEENV